MNEQHTNASCSSESWHAECFITGMIAASHIATTATASAATSSRTGTRHDDATQSFSESLGQAKQAAHDEHTAQQNSSSSKRSKDSKDDAKTHVRRDDNNTEAANTAQQAEPVDQTASVLSLPTHLFQQDTQKAGDFADAFGTSNENSKPSLTIDTQAGNSLVSSTWSQQGLSFGGAKSGAVLGTIKSVIDDQGVDVQSTISAAPAGAASAVPGSSDINEDADPTISAKIPEQPATSSPLLQDPVAQAQAAAANAASNTVQLENAPQMGATPQNFAPSAGVAGISATAGVASAKASAALKGLQNIAGGNKNADGITNKNVAGAKETDSYLSIQKNTKDETSSAKDSLSTSSQQHSSRNDQAADPVVAQTVVPSQIHAVVNSQPHSPNTRATVDSAKAANQTPANNAGDTNLDRTTATSQAPTPEHISTIVNSAKLIQSISQSEMRVGMRTAEFGDISIRTASTRDAISAQISLAHGDLAKTLTAHMPEMQTRLTSGEVVNVSIQHEGQSGSYDGGRSDANQSGSQSQAKDEGSSRSNQYGAYSPSTAASAVSAPVFATRSETAGRLDIRA